MEEKVDWATMKKRLYDEHESEEYDYMSAMYDKITEHAGSSDEFWSQTKCVSILIYLSHPYFATLCSKLWKTFLLFANTKLFLENIQTGRVVFYNDIENYYFGKF